MDQYTELRTLLLQQEQNRIDELEQRIADLQQRSQDVAEILPNALQNTPNFEALITALQAPVDNCVKTTVKTDPTSFADPLLPVITPIIQQPLLDRHQELASLAQQNVEQLHTRLQSLAKLEQQNIEQLQTRLQVLEKALIHFEELENQLNDAENRVKELASFLPKAIRQASDDQPTQATTAEEEAELTDSLKLPVQRCLRQSISEDTETLADTLFPVMGPAIRKSIHESLKGFIEEINTRLEQSPMSPQGLNWWIESKRKGIPVRELILRDTLVYRIEEVFLIHNESGLLIHHLHQEDIEVGDSDAVSAMFTAIQDFIRDSFSSTRNASLDKVEIGEHMVWLERGPYAVLACVIRGAAPYEYKNLMSQVIETLHARYGQKLKNFDGDNTPLQPCLPLLQKTLQSERKEKEKKGGIPRGFVIAAVVLMILSLGGMGWWQYDLYQQRDVQARIGAYMAALQQTPGIVPVSHTYDRNTLTIQGLRDPLAIATTALPEYAALQDMVVHQTWKPYQDLTPAFTEQRLQQALAPPGTVEVELVEDILYLKGHADNAWIETALQEVRQVSGVTEVVTRELVESDAYWQQTQPLFKQLVQRLDATPGLVVIASGVESAQYFIRGLRDPLATDPISVSRDTAFAALQNIAMVWQPYQDLSPDFVEQRALAWLQPPDTVDMRLDGTTLVVSGNANRSWIVQLEASLGKINGVNALDTQQLIDNDAYWAKTRSLFADLVAALNATVGLTVVESGIADNRYFVQGLRDPLAPDPQTLINQFPELHVVKADWQAYKDLSPALVKQRAIAWLQPPPSVNITLHGTTLKLAGEASDEWINTAHNSLGKMAGIEELDLTELHNTDSYWLATRPQFEQLIAQLNATTGLTVIEHGVRADRYYLRGLRDPLAPDPARLVAQFPELVSVEMHWQSYQDLAPELVKHRATAWLKPPDTVTVSLQGAKLTLAGKASNAWINHAEDSLGKIAGVEKLDISGLINTDAYWLETAESFAGLVAKLNATAGLIVVESGVADNRYFVRGLRDPLALEPSTLLTASGLTDVAMEWQAYQDLAPTFVLQRAYTALQPPDTVNLSLQDNTLKLTGEAAHRWIVQAQQAAGSVAGIEALDTTELVDADANWLATRPRFEQLVQQLNATDGLIVVESGVTNERYFIHGLRDPLASDPADLLAASGLTDVMLHWQPYQDLSPEFVLQRAQHSLQPPTTVQLTLQDRTLLLTGHAPHTWISTAQASVGKIAGITAFDFSELRDDDVYWHTTRRQFNALIERLNASEGIMVTSHGVADSQYFINGIRDPLAVDPQHLLAESGLDDVKMQWQPYQDLSPQFAQQRLLAWLEPPDTIQVAWQADNEVLLSGEASSVWLERVQRITPNLWKINAENVTDQDEALRQQLMESIKGTQIFFSEETTIRAGQQRKLKKLAEEIQQLVRLNQGSRLPLRIEITGNTDGLGTRLHNQQLGLQRAIAVRNWLHNEYRINHQYLLVMPPSRVRSGAVGQNFNLRYVEFQVNS